MTTLIDATKLIDTVGSAVDKNFESGEERQKQLSSRHRVDMSSDSWLSKNIRPLTLIFLMLCEAGIIVAGILGKTIDLAITSQIGLLLFGAFGFYFNSKKGERIMEKRIEGAAKIERIRVDAQIKEKRKNKRLERRLAGKNN